MLAAVLIVTVTGIAAGAIGAMLGVGGAVLIVPVLNIGLGLPIFSAAAVGLLTVIGTSSSVTTAPTSRELVNVRIALVVLVGSVIGALSGVHSIKTFVSERAAELVFGGSSLVICGVMLSRIDQRNTITGVLADVGTFGGRFVDPETRQAVSYRVRRLPLIIGASFVAGVVSSIAGIGGGSILVPVLNSWCGVPMRAATTTSAFIIGITAVPGIIGHYRLGHLVTPELAAAAVLGVLGGARLGIWISRRVSGRALKLFMATLLLVTGLYYVFWGRH
jgi:uncharacterized membrane protein YfcA